ncbi:ACP S-malonyltransferase [Mycolicibacterium stellerae]|uniref:ACP S-malonyltransferase n=1 Tax=Mycolicibacterium stellerae TaxID=2358193 RepID=UPI000F0B7FFC|nr:acyltransferase domain-containing protein [Mycolicibacterium stellerae]
MSLAFLFPGQGSQQPNMLKALPRTPVTEAVLDEFDSWADASGRPTDVDGSDTLRDTAHAQIALLVAGVACARALREDHGLTPEFVAGHSVGAFAAAVSAGVVTFSEALAAVELRGNLMKEACAQGDWGMAAVIGLPTRAAREFAAKHADLWVANINSATQTVLSGSRNALLSAATAAEAHGAGALDFLDVDVASHCPLQGQTADRMAVHLSALTRRTPSGRYLTNTGGRAVGTADAVLDDLAAAVAQPVRWYDATRLMPELGVTCAIEMRPGHVLTRLNTANAPTVVSLSLQDDSFESVAGKARRSIQ